MSSFQHGFLMVQVVGALAAADASLSIETAEIDSLLVHRTASTLLAGPEMELQRHQELSPGRA